MVLDEIVVVHREHTSKRSSFSFCNSDDDAWEEKDFAGFVACARPNGIMMALCWSSMWMGWLIFHIPCRDWPYYRPIWMTGLWKTSVRGCSCCMEGFMTSQLDSQAALRAGTVPNASACEFWNRVWRDHPCNLVHLVPESAFGGKHCNFRLLNLAYWIRTGSLV